MVLIAEPAIRRFAHDLQGARRRLQRIQFSSRSAHCSGVSGAPHAPSGRPGGVHMLLCARITSDDASSYFFESKRGLDR
jgi:hypothetical protein